MEVHLLQRLLHMQDVRRAMLDELRAVAQECAEGTHLGVRAEGGGEQPQRVELLQPLTILHIRLAARDVPDGACVDQEALDAALFEYLEGRNPVDAGGFHSDGVHAAGEQPIGEAFQVGGEGGETAHRLAGVVWADGGPDFVAADVEAGRVGVDDCQSVQVVHCNLREQRIGVCANRFPKRAVRS